MTSTAHLDFHLLLKLLILELNINETTDDDDNDVEIGCHTYNEVINGFLGSLSGEE